MNRIVQESWTAPAKRSGKGYGDENVGCVVTDHNKHVHQKAANLQENTLDCLGKFISCFTDILSQTVQEIHLFSTDRALDL